jgi:hypothetical protein
MAVPATCSGGPDGAGDALGNIALFDAHGKEIWEQHVKSMITQVRAARWR